MSALVRETALGQFLRIATRGRILQYPEEASGFVVPEMLKAQGSPPATPVTDETTVVDPEAAVGGVEKKAAPASERSQSPGAEASVVVNWYGDADPDNPQNWSVAKKALVTFIICTLTFGVYIGSSLITSGFESLMEEFGVNEQTATVTLSMYVICYGIGALFFSPLSEIPAYGRNPFYWAPMVAFVAFQAGASRVHNFTGLVLLRMLTAFLGGPVLSTGGATLADMYSPMAIPTVFSIWVLPAFSGPAIGPIIGNFAAQANGWRWTMYELLWISGFVTILLVFLMPETSSATILHRRAARLRAVTGNTAYRSQAELTHGHKTPGVIIQEAILRPFQITVLDPSIFFANAYTALVYAFYYLFFDSFPTVYGAGVFNFSFGAQGVAYVSIIVGGIVGATIYIGYQQLYMNNYWYPTKGWPVNEKRLEPAVISSAFAPIGLFIFAWTSRTSVNWSGSLIGTGIYAAANFVTLQCLFFYIVLSYPAYAASILAANDFLRALAATGFLHIGIPMFRTLHIDGGVSLLAGLTCFGVPGIWLIYHYGARLREKSRFAVGDAPQ